MDELFYRTGRQPRGDEGNGGDKQWRNKFVEEILFGGRTTDEGELISV
jgi:hypothetical protein